MRFFSFLLLAQLFLSASLFANCELIENDAYYAYQQFKESESLHSDQQHSEAYDMLLKSFKTYKPKTKTILLESTCVNYIPGPYAPTIQRSTKRDSYDFDRTALGIEIKHQLSPAPFVFVQFQKNKTIVSAINSTKTSRNEIKKRLPLENFAVSIDGKKFQFGNLEVGKLKSIKRSIRLSENDTIKTNEQFGFKLYK